MILNDQQLESRAQNFALTNELVAPRRFARNFWPAFRSDMDSLTSFAARLAKTRVECTQPAEDWLLDHVAFLESQAQDVLQRLPRATLHQLPRIRNTGTPRVYALCEDYLDHTDGSYDVSSFEKYLLAYQQVSVLKTLECWILPSAMRVVIIRRLASAMHEVRYRHDVCARVASVLEQCKRTDKSDEDIRALLVHETREKPLSPVEIVHFVSHLTEWEPDFRVVHEWLMAHIENSESSLEHMSSYEHQLQAQLQVTSGNLVRSLHVLERFPWRHSFAKISRLERTLSSHAGTEYAKLDLASRDLLRNRAVEIAEQLRVPEILVAETAIKLAESSDGHSEKDVIQLAKQDQPAMNLKNTDSPDSTDRPGRPGSLTLQPRTASLAYYLLDAHGIRQLRSELSKVVRPRRLKTMAIRRHPLSTYLWSFALLFVLWMMLFGVFVTRRPVGVSSMIAIFAVLAVPVSEWVVTTLHFAIQMCCRPTPLLRYDFSEELPDSARTMVVMPIMWSSVKEVDEVMNRLLVHHFANRQQNIYFAVLADLPDAAKEQMDGDDEIVTHAVKRIRELQEKYGRERFFLFHRARRYNQRDNIYMGWERKRGKLVEFVDLLSGESDTSFTTVDGATHVLPQIRYVFTIDHDTELPIGTVSRMAGTIHYPYNRPRLNAKETRVIEGFGVLQPRVSVSFESTTSSRFASLWAGEPGIDPYAFAVSNPYQDLFGKAIFVGKGIFDVEAFRKTVSNRISDNSVLSHDVLEGGFLRTGLTADIEVVEDHPQTFYAYQKRAHRWIRGDWQLIRWLGRSCQNRQGESQTIDLCGLTRWQIIDNLRRSLVAPTVFVTMLLGLFILPGQPSAYEAFGLLTLFSPFIHSVVDWARGRKPVSSVGVSLLQSGFRLLTLPFTVVLSVDAIIRTIYRMTISRRKLLEWVPAAKTKNGVRERLVFVYEPVGYLLVLLFVLSSFLFAGALGRGTSVSAFAVWILFARPAVNWLNRRRTVGNFNWVAENRQELEQFARRIWDFYEQYVTEEESWLPPDNVQYHPEERIAHRTSPTNIGLYLACVVAAADLGFIDASLMVTRLESTIRTLFTLPKWHGHLFNWYDSESGAPLPPKYVSTVDSGNLVAYLMVVSQGLASWSHREPALQSRISHLIDDIESLIEQTDFQTLFNPDEQVFCLGYHADANQKEQVLYDLLASEARQGSFVAIALGQIPASHWFALGRTMTIAANQKTLLSWSGTMFEYLMPSLIMRTYPKTVWDSTYRGVVKRQMEYGKSHNVPFGISESGYYAFDYQLNYQYRAFGVPGLGFDRGLERNLVVTPYATMLSLPFTGEAGLRALREFQALGASGEYGFYEAVDFTTHRLPPGSRYEVVQSFMAHHQGMSLLSLANLLTNEGVIERFHADKRVQAADLLLQERIPAKVGLIEKPIGVQVQVPDFTKQVEEAVRTFTEPTSVVHVNVVSNGRMTSVHTNDGTGMLLWKGLMLTRWREDPVADTSGAVLYIHDVDSEDTFSATDFPGRLSDEHKTVFGLDKTTYEGMHRGVHSKLEIAISGDLDAEVRRLRIVNHSDEERTLEVTSFFELALASQDIDSAHPAFSKLFVQTMHDEDAACLLAKRRPREEKESETWAVHSLYVDGREIGEYEFETDRAAFIGRGGSIAKPRSLTERLHGSAGSVADPAFIMRRCIRLAKGESATLYAVTGVADSRDAAVEIIEKLCEPLQAERAFHLAWVRTQIDLRHLRLTPEQAVSANQLASSLLYTPPLSRKRRQAIVENDLGQSALWTRGISGDAPIATVQVSNIADLSFVVGLAKRHQYLCKLGLAVDLVVLDDTTGGYQDELMHRLREELSVRGIGEMKRIIGLKTGQLSDEERTLLTAVSRVWLHAGGPSLQAQLQASEQAMPRLAPQSTAVQVPSRRMYPKALPSRAEATSRHMRRDTTHPHSEFFNGFGGFVENGKAYEIHVEADQYLPRPWTNVLSNPRFGTLLTELGTGYTWWHNSREFKLTPWTNDPVIDRPGECLYLRDLDTDDLWSAAPKPIGEDHAYTVTHGFGYTRIERTDGDIVHTMDTTVPVDDPLKLVRLVLRNKGDRPKRIAVTYYAEWVLGVMREAQAPYIVTEWDALSQTLLARNTYQETFREATAFLHMLVKSQQGEHGAPQSKQAHHDSLRATGGLSFTGDRSDFIGRGGSLAHPVALFDGQLSCRTGAFSNTCGAIQTVVEVPAGGEQTVVILLGCGDSTVEVESLIAKYKGETAYDETLSDVSKHWQQVTEQVQVQTPDRAMDLMLNGWLLYQALGCRLYARTGFYQAGGAFGFRDQLQDTLAFLHVNPTILRDQILNNSEHQYLEGDVQHWWHEETGKGIRTRYSDDLLWLPYAVSRYIHQTGDVDILREEVPFLQSDPLKEDELERYEDTVVSQERASILEHCVRAIRHASKFGEHGIPLMGIGDWNDGMNRVGAKGRGESVWLGWFLLNVLKRFSDLHSDVIARDLAQEFSETAAELEAALNGAAWDGAWFRRAFTDSGEWLGSIVDKECRIDAIAQSWSVISQGTTPDRQFRAMRSFDKELVDRDLGLVRLLTRAFDETQPSPGYIQGYPPGIRENGGQYTHGVIWSIVAWAMLGRRDKAFELFSLLNPISHTQTPKEVLTFGNEPYVMSADVYTANPHEGQAGWSWYTGSGGWMYQAGLEYILGVRRIEDKLYVKPCVPETWTEFTVTYRYGQATYHIEVACGEMGETTSDAISEDEMSTWVVDGEEMSESYLQLVDDGEEHQVAVYTVPQRFSTVG